MCINDLWTDKTSYYNAEDTPKLILKKTKKNENLLLPQREYVFNVSWDPMKH